MKNEPIKKNRRSLRPGSIIIELIMLGFSFTMLVPFFWMFSTSLRLPKDSFKMPPTIFPTGFSLDSYMAVLNEVPYLNFYWNSLKIALCVVLGVVVSSTLAAYAFSHMKFPGRDLLFLLMLTGIMIPTQVTIIPQFIMLTKLGWMDQHISLIIPAMFSPLSIFLVRQHMKGIPATLDEAATIDGAGDWRIFFSIILPIAAPSVIVVAVLSFIASWNEFFRALIFLNTFEKMTIPIGITILRGTYGSGNLSTILAGVVLSVLASLVFYILGQRYLVSDLNSGSVKG